MKILNKSQYSISKITTNDLTEKRAYNNSGHDTFKTNTNPPYLSSRKSNQEKITFCAKYYPSGFYNDEEIFYAEKHKNYKSKNEIYEDILARDPHVQALKAQKAIAGIGGILGKGGWMARDIMRTGSDIQIHLIVDGKTNKIMELIPDLKAEHLEQEEIATDKQNKMSLKLIELAKQKQNIKDRLTKDFSDLIILEQKGKGVTIPNCIMLTGESDDIPREICEWIGENSDCNFIKLMDPKRPKQKPLPVEPIKAKSYTPAYTPPKTFMEFLLSATQAQLNKPAPTSVETKVQAPDLDPIVGTPQKHLQETLSDALERAEEEYLKNKRRTLIYVEGFDKLLNPKHNSEANIECLKDIMGNCATESHATIIFSSKDISEFDPILIQPHRVNHIIPISIKSIEEDAVDAAAKREKEITTIRSRLNNMERITKHPLDTINDLINLFASEDKKPLKAGYSSYEFRRTEAVFKNIEHVFREDKNKSLKNVLEITLNALRK